MNFPRLVIMPAPCGCVIVYTPSDGPLPDILECGWCGATYDTAEFFDWADGSDAPEIWPVFGERTLVQFGARLLEMRGDGAVRDVGDTYFFRLDPDRVGSLPRVRN